MLNCVVAFLYSILLWACSDVATTTSHSELQELLNKMEGECEVEVTERNGQGESSSTANPIIEQSTVAVDDNDSARSSDPQDEIRQLREQIENITCELNDTKSENAALKTEITVINNILNVTRIKLENKCKQYDSVVRSNDRRRAKLVAEHEIELDALEAEHDEECDKLNVEKGQLGNKLGILRKDNGKLKNEIETLQKKLNVTTQELGKLRSRKPEQHAEDIEEWRTKYNKQTGYLGSLLGDMRKSYEELTNYVCHTTEYQEFVIHSCLEKMCKN